MSQVYLKDPDADFLELSQELLNRGALLRFRAHGRSMQPFIKNGDILIVEPLNGASASIGDVIFYRRSDSSFTAHRLINVTGGSGGDVLLSRGDSLNYFDPPIQPEQVMGRVIQIEGSRKQLILTGWLGCPFGFIIALFSRGRYPNQRRVIRNLGRLWWLIGGRRIK
jgi:signal peptidase I